MNYIITADTSKSWTIGEMDACTAEVIQDRNEANKKWVQMKNNTYFSNMKASKAQNIKKHYLRLYQTKQRNKPIFASEEKSWDIARLFRQAYGSMNYEEFMYVLPDVDFGKMKFDHIADLDPKTYGEDYETISVVREKEFGSKFYLTTTFARYDEMLDGREDVCEIRLHPYCSDFKLVEEIEFEYRDYDM